jgi:hypothetical protein
VTLFHLEDVPDLREPALVVALDGWVDAGSAATLAAKQLADEGPVVARFDGDALFDYRARRPTLEIVDGRLSELTWPELTLRRAAVGGRDLLVLAGHEPDYRWPRVAEEIVHLAHRLEVAEWISLGAIPAAVPHTRPVPILGTESKPGLLRADVQPGPSGTLRVPSALVSVLEMSVAEAGIAAVGYFAQVPHYVSGPYPAAAVGLLDAVSRHLGIDLPLGALADEARQLRDRLDTATAVDETSRAYVERLEAMVDEARLPSGDDLISEIERFLRARGSEGPPGGSGSGLVN